MRTTTKKMLTQGHGQRGRRSGDPAGAAPVGGASTRLTFSDADIRRKWRDEVLSEVKVKLGIECGGQDGVLMD